VNWYPRYYGDYMRDTAHLSLVEHGVYAVMLDHYYATGGPLPDDLGALYRICRAFEDCERAAVQSIASAYFPVNGDGMRHNRRADRELAKMQEHAERLANAGRKGGLKSGEARLKPGLSEAASPAEANPHPHITSTSTPTSTANSIPPIPPGGTERVAKKRLSATEKKRARVTENTPDMVRIGLWFGRRESTPWTVAEAEALAQCAPTAEDLAELEAYYTADMLPANDYRRRAVEQLLNNWQGEIDRARAWRLREAGAAASRASAEHDQDRRELRRLGLPI
jgi:uncharacterized protein YdaU (DUF1376 family)